MKLQILVPLHTYPERNSDRIALHAAVMARHLDADIRALVLTAGFPKVSSALGDLLIDVPAMMEDAKAKCHSHGAALIKALEAELRPMGVPLRSTETECLTPAVGSLVAERARYHDLTLIGLPPGAGSVQVSAEAAIFESGRPILLVPETAAPGAPDHVVIAWDGSRVAARAVADARDLLQRARAVTIATVVGEKPLPEDDLGERLTEHLAGHGVDAQVARVQGAGRPIAESLQAHARDLGAGLLVMGGFGHSRVRDFVLGGATAGILKDLQIPVLISH
jgi:nucleotide-binding universal stress UspA family protein